MFVQICIIHRIQVFTRFEESKEHLNTHSENPEIPLILILTKRSPPCPQ
jgi:hypothetical protein